MSTVVSAPLRGEAVPARPAGRRTSAASFSTRKAPSRAVAILLGASFPVALVLAWWGASLAGWLPKQILPAPPVVWATFLELIEDGSLATHTLESLRRVAIGYLFGAAFGLTFGTAVGLSHTLRAYLYPPLQAAAQVNVLGWMPLLVLFLGIDEPLKYVVIAWASSVPIILGTARGIQHAPPALRELGRVLDFDTADTLRLIVLPAALPSVFTGLREGLANAWQTLVIVELFASFEGLGYLMTWGRQLFQLELVVIAMLVIAAIGLALDAILRRLERLGQPWKTDAEHGF